MGVKAPPKNKDVYLSYVSPIHYNSVVVSTVDNQSHAGWARTEDPATGRTYYSTLLVRVWFCRVDGVIVRRRRGRNATDPREVESVTTPSPRDTRPRAGRDSRDELDVAARDFVSLRAIGGADAVTGTPSRRRRGARRRAYQ